MAIILITHKNKAIEYENFNETDIDTCLTEYIKNEVVFGRGFTLSESDWNNTLAKYTSVTLKIVLLNSLCKRSCDKLAKIVTNFSPLYPRKSTVNDVNYCVCKDSYVKVLGTTNTMANYISILNKFDELPVTKIEDYAFSNNKNLSNISIPSSITSIGIGAFSNCTNLNGITIPNYIQSIKTKTFYNCTRLTIINIPRSVTLIEAEAFTNCKNVTIHYQGTADEWANKVHKNPTGNPANIFTNVVVNSY